jgi:hypothetical protein
MPTRMIHQPRAAGSGRAANPGTDVTAVLHDSPALRLYVPRDSVGPGGLIDRPDLRDGLARALATFAGQLR